MRHGLWVSMQRSIVRVGTAGAEAIAAAMDRLSTDPPSEVAGESVTSVVDYQQGAEQRPRWLPAASLVELGFESGSRILVRPSGTEPKLKIYADWVGRITDAGGWRKREAELLADAAAAVDDMVERLAI